MRSFTTTLAPHFHSQKMPRRVTAVYIVAGVLAQRAKQFSSEIDRSGFRAAASARGPSA